MSNNEREEIIDSNKTALAENTAKTTEEHISALPDEGDTKPKKRNMSVFSRFLLIYAAVLLCAGIVGSFVCWEALSQYEDSQPKHVMEQVCSDIMPYLKQGLIAEYSEKVSEYENVNDVVEQVLLPAFAGEYSFKKAVREYTSENPVYTVHTDSDVANITLSKTGVLSSFGFDSWEVSGVRIIADMSGVSTVSTTVEAPVGATLTINGKDAALSPSEKKAYPFALRYEQGMELPEYAVYTVGGLFSEPRVSVSIDGEQMTENAIDGKKVFSYPEPLSHSVSITVPYKNTVKLGGVKLTSSEISDGEVKFDGASKYDNAHYVRYSVPGLISCPVVEVFDENGKKCEGVVSDENGLSYTLPYLPSEAHSISVVYPTEGCILEINGVDASSELSENTEHNISYPYTDGLTSYIKGHIQLGQVSIQNIYGEPELKCKTADGRELSVSVTEQDGKISYVFSPAEDDSLKGEYEKYAVSYTEDYIKYASGGYMIVNSTFAQAASHLQSGSPAYTKLESTKFSFGQNKPYTVKKQEISTYGYMRLGENCFTCLVDFAVDVTTSYNVEQKDQRDEVKGMRLTFAEINGKWKIVGLSM